MKQAVRIAVFIGLTMVMAVVGVSAAESKKPGGKALLPDIGKLAWLAGSWRAEKSGRMIEEQWMAPVAGVMLGMSRTIAKGKVVEHGFLQIRVGPGGELFYIAQPSGQKEAAFQITSLTDREAVFANPNHDFPRKISYTLNADGSMLAAIEGPGAEGDVKRIEYSYQRINP